jgi:hypothetical protein
MTVRFALALAVALGALVLVGATVEKRDDRTPSPAAVMKHVQRAVRFDAAVAAAWPNIGNSERQVAATAASMERAVQDSTSLAARRHELTVLARGTLRRLLVDEARLRERQHAALVARTRLLARPRWWLAIWCDEAWEANQAALLRSGLSVLRYYGVDIAPDRPHRERALMAMVQCRRAIRFSIADTGPVASRERASTDWFLPVARENAELVRRIQSFEPVGPMQRRWRTAVLAAS